MTEQLLLQVKVVNDRYWVGIAPTATFRQLRAAVDEACLATGTAVRCINLQDAENRFLPDALPVQTLLADRDSITANVAAAVLPSTDAVTGHQALMKRLVDAFAALTSVATVVADAPDGILQKATADTEDPAELLRMVLALLNSGDAAMVAAGVSAVHALLGRRDFIMPFVRSNGFGAIATNASVLGVPQHLKAVCAIEEAAAVIDSALAHQAATPIVRRFLVDAAASNVAGIRAAGRRALAALQIAVGADSPAAQSAAEDATVVAEVQRARLAHGDDPETELQSLVRLSVSKHPPAQLVALRALTAHTDPHAVVGTLLELHWLEALESSTTLEVFQASGIDDPPRDVGTDGIVEGMIALVSLLRSVVAKRGALAIDSSKLLRWLLHCAVHTKTGAPTAPAIQECLITLYSDPRTLQADPQLLRPLLAAKVKGVPAMAANALAAFSARDEQNALAPFIPLLVGLLGHADATISIPSLVSVGYLCLKHRNRAAIVGAGAIPALATCVASSDARLPRIAAKALANLATADAATQMRIQDAVTSAAPEWRKLEDPMLQMYMGMVFDR